MNGINVYIHIKRILSGKEKAKHEQEFSTIISKYLSPLEFSLS